MRSFDVAVGQHIRDRGAKHAHLFASLTGRNRANGNVETTGFWTGADHEDFVADGVTQTFFGAGTIMQVSPIVSDAGLKVRTLRLVFSSVPAEVQIAARQYDLRRQPCRLYVGYFDPETHALIGSLQRVFKGFSAGLEITRPEVGGAAEMVVNLLSNSRALTKTLSLKKSQAALTARNGGDTFRQFTDISGAVEAVWGETRASAPSPTAAPPAPPSMEWR